jgi:hypothetical protein
MLVDPAKPGSMRTFEITCWGEYSSHIVPLCKARSQLLYLRSQREPRLRQVTVTMRPLPIIRPLEAIGRPAIALG